jgi:hypothetical protein
MVRDGTAFACIWLAASALAGPWRNPIVPGGARSYLRAPCKSHSGSLKDLRIAQHPAR